MKLPRRSGEEATLEIQLTLAGEDGVQCNCVPLALLDDNLIITVERNVSRKLREAVVVQAGRFHLRWEEMDPKRSMIHQRSAPVGTKLMARLTPDQSGVELLGIPEGPPAIWAPGDHKSQLPKDGLARAGWEVEPPRLTWRYAPGEEGSTGVCVTWECSGLPDAWLQALSRSAPMDCVLEPGIRMPLVRTPHRPGLLRMEGRASISGDDLPLMRRVRCRAPLALAQPGRDARHEVEELYPADFRIRDVWAMVDGVRTRFVANPDLEKRFMLLVQTDHATILPGTFPRGTFEKIPWDVRVVIREVGEDTCLWELSAAREAPEPEGRWGGVDWTGNRLALHVTASGSEDVPHGPVVRKIHDRRLRRAWDVEEGGSAHRLLRLVRPVWTALDTSLPELDDPGADGVLYQERVRVMVQGSEEWFDRDGGSEVPQQPLLIDPTGWTVRDASGALTEAEVYGTVGGQVRWRRPIPDPRAAPVSASDWAQGGGTVLLVRDGSNPTSDWGGFWVPETVAWERLSERMPAPGGPDLRIHVAPGHSELWIYLWGFLARYRREETYLDVIDAPVTVWVTAEHIPLYPIDDAVLLRAFCPLCVVSEAGRTVRLAPQSPRPILSLGTELRSPRADGSVKVECVAPLRLWCGWGTRETCPDTLSYIGRESLLSARSLETPALWAGLDQGGDESSGGGWLLSRNSQGEWFFRGFYAAQGSSVDLGELRDGSGRRLRLAESEVPAGREFTRTRSASGGDEWHGNVPPELTNATSTAERLEVLSRFAHHFKPDGKTVHYTERVSAARQPHGIRVWELPRDGRGEVKQAEPAEGPFHAA